MTIVRKILFALMLLPLCVGCSSVKKKILKSDESKNEETLDESVRVSDYVLIPQDVLMDVAEYSFLNWYNCCYNISSVNHRKNEFHLSKEVKSIYSKGFGKCFEFNKIGMVSKIVVNPEGDGVHDTIVPDIHPRKKGIFYKISDSQGNVIHENIYNNLGQFVQNKYGDYFEYDALGRATKIVRDGACSTFDYLDNKEVAYSKYADTTKNSLVEYIHFDRFGFPDTVFNKWNGPQRIISRYDTFPSGAIKSKEILNNKAGSVGVNETTIVKFTFNKNGDILTLSRKNYDNYQKKYSDNEMIYSWLYDKEGKLVECNKEGRKFLYRYHGNGKRSDVKEYEGAHLCKEVTYDLYGNELKKIIYNNSDDIVNEEDFEYTYFQ